MSYVIKWREASANRRIFAAAFIIAVVTLFVKLLSMAKESVVAYRFGLGDDLDAFLIAFVIPSFAISVVAGSFNAAFIPTFVRVYQQQGQAAAQRLLSNVTAVNLALLLASAVLLAIFAAPLLSLVAGEFGPAKRALTQELFYWLLPAIVVNGLIVLWASVLNAGERFALVALAPIMTPLSLLVALLIFASRWGIHVMVWGTLIGMLTELLALGVALKRRGFALTPRWHAPEKALQDVLGQYLPMIFGAFLMSSTSIVDQTMAAWLDPGSVAALSFGNKVPALVASLGAMALGTAVLPYYSKLVASGDMEGLRQTFKTYARLILWVTIPLTALGFITSEWVVRLLFERGTFGANETALVADVQRFYLLQTPFYFLGILGVRVISAFSKNHLLMIISAVNLVVNVIGNYLLAQVFGVAGIALSTAFVYMVAMTMTLFFVFRLTRAAMVSQRSPV